MVFIFSLFNFNIDTFIICFVREFLNYLLSYIFGFDDLNVDWIFLPEVLYIYDVFYI